MNILLVHNFYQQPGGEDQVFASEADLLARFGHRVRTFTVHNDRLRTMNGAAAAVAAIWNPASGAVLGRAVRDHRAQVVHFHNTFPLISPAGYAAARRQGAAVVQTLHNFRLLCPNALLFRDGKPCEQCVGRRLAWPGIAHGCYRNSRLASAVNAVGAAVHRAMGFWRRLVDVYIALSRFSSARLTAGGLPAQKIVVKPNFIDPDPGPGTQDGGYALFAGRLSAEKGVGVLLKAWSELRGPVELKILGDGELQEQVRAAAAADRRIQWLGRRPPQQVQQLVGQARCVVVSSECYENFPRLIVEAFARGTPVIASRLGAMAELVDHEHTGLLFTPGDAADLARCVERLWNDPALLQSMRAAARSVYQQRYTGLVNHRMLMDIYQRALRLAGHRNSAAAPAAPA